MRHTQLLLLLPLAAAQLATPPIPHNDTTYNFLSTLDDSTTPSSPLYNSTEPSCHDVRGVPREDQCVFAEEFCEDYRIGFVNYVSWYYCGGSARFVSLCGYVLVLICLFTTLGITASEFLCPNLDTISKFFRMSESLAGVTLLALGNGSPDVFSTLEAMKIDSADLALGELVGAALFITAVVVGSMAIVRPFKVVKRPFVRDVLFLLCSISITAVFLADGVLSMFEAVAMIVMYLAYVVFVVCWDWVVTKRRKVQLLDQKMRNHFFDDTSRYSLAQYQVEDNNEINDEDIWNDISASGTAAGIEVLDQQLSQESETSFDDWARSSQVNRFRPSILGALDLNNRMNDLRSGSAGAISLDTMPEIRSAETPVIRMSSAPEFRDADEAMSVDEYEARTSQSAPAAYDLDDPVTAMEFNGEIPDYIEAHNSLKTFLQQNNFLQQGGVFLTLFPTLKDISKKSVTDKVINILCLPTVTVLRLTIPVIVTENKQIDNETALGSGFFLLLLQCICSPFITMFLMLYDDEFTWSFIVVPTLLSLILITCAFTFRTIHRNAHNACVSSIFTCCLSCAGFMISICWISTIATELIGIIKFFSVLLDLSDAILGVTVFAIGNSLGDFISNFTIAKMGFPTMALSACFGGPLLNVLLGVGGSALYVIPSTGADIDIHISRTLQVSGITLLINLCGLLVCVPLNGWRMDQRIGTAMIALWCGATSVCVVLELLG